MHQPKKDHTVLIALSVLAVVTLLAGAAWFLTRDAPESKAAPLKLPTQWPTSGGELVRPVPMPTGELAVALPPRTAGHVLCGAVPEPTWAAVLGGPVLREVNKTGNCHVVSANLEVSAEQWAEPVPMRGTALEQVAVAGRQATLGKLGVNGFGEVLTVELSSSKEKWVRPVLQLIVNRVPQDRGEHDLRGMVVSLAEKMIGAITTPGPKLPADDESREMTPIPGSGITDAPYPLITWQLCTQLSRVLNVPLDQLEPGSFGSCERDNDGTVVRLEYDDERSEDYYPDRVAGRPAREKRSDSTVVVQLLDDSRQTLEISWIDATKPDGALRELAEKVVPPLLGR